MSNNPYHRQNSNPERQNTYPIFDETENSKNPPNRRNSENDNNYQNQNFQNFQNNYNSSKNPYLRENNGMYNNTPRNEEKCSIPNFPNDFPKKPYQIIEEKKQIEKKKNFEKKNFSKKKKNFK